MQNRVLPALVVMSVIGVAGSAHAHMGARGPAIANTTFVATFTVGHSCAAVAEMPSMPAVPSSDTRTVRISLPAGVTAVRPMHGGVFGRPTIIRDASEAIVAVEYTRPDDASQPPDELYHELSIRMRAPTAPFTALQFPSVQTCFDGREHRWEGEDAPTLRVLPPRSPGWNQITMPEGTYDLDAIAAYFGDAAIVWLDRRAWSPNATTRALIESDPAAEPLTAIESTAAAPAAVWVRY
ncbi:DUF1775 domain-containing protein [Sandaracinus amylolyticus]|uniref:DUF1775 domain-containing protein n=1 Tax=Sandaracinus amylolyticus TaxID=927083 RepID=UPI001F1CC8A4|nr:DUF1775 domain-containing protein [Sandaracinus amylolyticus]UJR82450.1 Hypothetical protein I5071_45150 [Sandaracinus amylolyticus]